MSYCVPENVQGEKKKKTGFCLKHLTVRQKAKKVLARVKKARQGEEQDKRAGKLLASAAQKGKKPWPRGRCGLCWRADEEIGSRCTGECGSQVMQRGRGETQRTERETTTDSGSSEQTSNRL